MFKGIIGSGLITAGGFLATLENTQPGSLEALYKCDDASGAVTDSGGNGHDLDVITGTPVYQVAGKITGTDAIQWPSTASSARRDSSTLFATLPAEWTIHWLYRFDFNVGALAGLFCFDNSADADPSLQVRTAGDGTGLFVFGNSDAGVNHTNFTTSDGVLVVGDWHSVVLRRKSGMVDLIVNNVVVGNQSTTQGTTTFDQTCVNTRTATLGQTRGTHQFGAYWSTGLTDAELTTLFALTGI